MINVLGELARVSRLCTKFVYKCSCDRFLRHCVELSSIRIGDWVQTGFGARLSVLFVVFVSVLSPMLPHCNFKLHLFVYLFYFVYFYLFTNVYIYCSIVSCSASHVMVYFEL